LSSVIWTIDSSITLAALLLAEHCPSHLLKHQVNPSQNSWQSQLSLSEEDLECLYPCRL